MRKICLGLGELPPDVLGNRLLFPHHLFDPTFSNFQIKTFVVVL